MSFGVVFFGTVARREVESIYISNWFYGALIIVVALLCWSFTKQLKKVDKAVEEGVFGEDAAAEAAEKKAAREPHDAEA